MTGSSGLLLDLGILTRIRGANPAPDIVQFLHRRRHQRIFVSALTLCQLVDRDGADDAGPDGGWLRELAERFASNILPVDHHIALACHTAPAGESGEPGVPGAPGKPGDSGGPGGPSGPAVLAATARHHRLTLVSTDAAAYAGLNVRVLDPLARPQPSVDPDPPTDNGT